MNIRLRDSLRDILLSSVEFVEMVGMIDSLFNVFDRSRLMVSNRKYSVLLSETLDAYGSKILALNDECIKMIAKIQKKFINKESGEDFLKKLYRELKFINFNTQLIRDTSISDNSDNSAFLDKIENVLQLIFGKNEEPTKKALTFSDFEKIYEGDQFYNRLHQVSRGLSSLSEDDQRKSLIEMNEIGLTQEVSDKVLAQELNKIHTIDNSSKDWQLNSFGIINESLLGQEKNRVNNGEELKFSSQMFILEDQKEDSLRTQRNAVHTPNIEASNVIWSSQKKPSKRAPDNVPETYQLLEMIQFEKQDPITKPEKIASIGKTTQSDCLLTMMLSPKQRFGITPATQDQNSPNKSEEKNLRPNCTTEVSEFNLGDIDEAQQGNISREKIWSNLSLNSRVSSPPSKSVVSNKDPSLHQNLMLSPIPEEKSPRASTPKPPPQLFQTPALPGFLISALHQSSSFTVPSRGERTFTPLSTSSILTCMPSPRVFSFCYSEGPSPSASLSQLPPQFEFPHPPYSNPTRCPVSSALYLFSERKGVVYRVAERGLVGVHDEAAALDGHRTLWTVEGGVAVRVHTARVDLLRGEHTPHVRVTPRYQGCAVFDICTLGEQRVGVLEEGGSLWVGTVGEGGELEIEAEGLVVVEEGEKVVAVASNFKHNKICVASLHGEIGARFLNIHILEYDYVAKEFSRVFGKPMKMTPNIEDKDIEIHMSLKYEKDGHPILFLIIGKESTEGASFEITDKELKCLSSFMIEKHIIDYFFVENQLWLLSSKGEVDIFE